MWGQAGEAARHFSGERVENPQLLERNASWPLFAFMKLKSG